MKFVTHDWILKMSLCLRVSPILSFAVTLEMNEPLVHLFIVFT